MFLAIAAETSRHPLNQNDYKIWYLEISQHGEVIGIGVKRKQEIIRNLFEYYNKTGKSNWKVFQKNEESSKTVQLFDFISKSEHENTHFGELPTLSEFQETLNYLQMNLELRSIA